jgi:hypothetical protein
VHRATKALDFANVLLEWGEDAMNFWEAVGIRLSFKVAWRNKAQLPDAADVHQAPIGHNHHAAKHRITHSKLE